MNYLIKLFLIITIFTTTSYAVGSSDGTEASEANKTEEKTYTSVNDITAAERTKLKAPLENLFKSTQWSLFLQEFEITWDIGTCGEGLDLAIGFRAHMIEPVGYMETTKKPLYFPFADLDLGGSLIKSCNGRAMTKGDSARDECMYNHFIFAPIMGMIFKKKLKFVCFHQGNIALPLLSEFDPTHLKDVYNYKMIPHVMAMISPEAIVSSIINCAATMSYSLIKGYATNTTGDSEKTWDSDSWAQEYEDPNSKYTNFKSASELKTKGLDGLAFIRNSMYYNLGCQGMHPVGGYVRGNDPGIDASLLAYGALSKLHAASALTQVPILKKQTEFGIELIEGLSKSTSVVSTLCESSNFYLPIESQYILQRAYPTVGSAKELGETGASMTTMANTPGAKDNFVYVLWLRRDYYAFAYECNDTITE